MLGVEVAGELQKSHTAGGFKRVKVGGVNCMPYEHSVVVRQDSQRQELWFASSPSSSSSSSLPPQVKAASRPTPAPPTPVPTGASASPSKPTTSAAARPASTAPTASRT